LLGTVALCAGCDVYPAWGAVVVGGLSGPIFMVIKYILLRFKIDDPLDAIPVHGAGNLTSDKLGNCIPKLCCKKLSFWTKMISARNGYFLT